MSLPPEVKILRSVSAVLLSVLFLSWPPGAAARLARLEGFYEFRADVNQEAANFNPNVGTQDRVDRGAKNYFQGRLYSDPHPGVNLFSKLELDSKNNDDQLRFSEAHLSFKKDVSGKGGEVILFENEERLTVQDPLLEITQSRGSKSGFEDLRGFRSNFWGWNGWATLVHGKIRSNGKADEQNDVYAVRLGKNLFPKNRLTLAGTANSKVWSSGRNSVGALDATLRFGSAEWIVAGATSHATGVSRGDATLFQSEVKNLTLGSRRFGSVRFSPSYRNIGSGYRNFLGKNPEKQEDGIYNELVYELPVKSMRLTWKQDLKVERFLNFFETPRRRTRWWYGELFMEFQKGYKAKVFYETKNDPWNGNLTRPAWFFQMESFSPFNTLKAQIKLKDHGNRYQKTVFGIENNHNLIRDRLYFLVRVLHAFEDEGDLNRTSVFTQLRCKIWENGNAFLEFGNGDHGNDDLTNDGSFADNSGANTDRLAKAILQLWW